ncbi:hypothetical protein DID75_01610 [Candidatus Marinamargulisbacteria bacterium SCGC AG-410-N11]|nr:hypothetical protein DID75_01610 [Candidatus Marinamargulisbacteria bacterium SCGC AG-410-N11]
MKIKNLIKSIILILSLLMVIGCFSKSTNIIDQNKEDQSIKESSSEVKPAPTEEEIKQKILPPKPEITNVIKNKDLTVTIYWKVTSQEDLNIEGFEIEVSTPLDSNDEWRSLVSIGKNDREYQTKIDHFILDKGFGSYNFRIRTNGKNLSGGWSSDYNYNFQGYKKYDKTWSTISPLFNQSVQFDTPRGLLWHSDKLLVADSGNNRIILINTDSTNEVTAITNTIYPTDPNNKSDKLYLSEPRDMTIADNGWLWIADSDQDVLKAVHISQFSFSIQQMPLNQPINNFDGNMKIAEFYDPRGVTSYKNFVYVADSGNKRIQKLDLTTPNNINIATSKLFTTYTAPTLGTTPIEFVNDITIWAPSDEQVYTIVLDKTKQSIFWFVNDSYKGTLSLKEELKNPTSIFVCNGWTDSQNTIQDQGTIFITDTDNHRIVILEPQLTQGGTYKWIYNSAFGTKGTQPGQFNRPSGITMDNKGNLYVSEEENNRIQIFKHD